MVCYPVVSSLGAVVAVDGVRLTMPGVGGGVVIDGLVADGAAMMYATLVTNDGDAETATKRAAASTSSSPAPITARNGT